MRFSELIDGFAPAEGPPPNTFNAFVRWCLAGSGRIIAFTAIASMLVGMLDVFAFFIIGWLIDFVLGQPVEGIWARNWHIFTAIAIFFIALRPALIWLNAALQQLAVMNNIFPLIMSRIHRHTIGQALSFFDDDFAGRIAQKQQQTARALADIVSELLQAGAFCLSAILGSAFLVGTIHPILGIALALWSVGMIVLVRWFIPRIRQRSKDRAAARAMVTGQVVDTITNMRTVKLFAHAAFEDQAAIGALRTFRERGLAFSTLTVWFRTSIMVGAGVLPVLMVGGGLYFWSLGFATPGDLAAAAMVSIRLAQMSGWVSFTALGVFANIGEVEDGIRTLAKDHTITDAPDAVPPSATKGRVTFDNVSFGYGRTGAALDGFTLDLAPGEKVGLVGRSGAGKTTAVSVLLRLYDLEDGEIRLDGTNIAALTQDGLRRQIAMVTQDTAMFNRSAADNIRYGNPEASDAEVIAAAKRAEADDFIQDLRDYKGRQGYEAHLGERGVKLSGGQRQRIALARAILKDAPVLVLDEATSALDSEVEAAIQASLAEVMRGKTVIAIAHRLSTIAAMDRIIVLDGGRIAEEGSHEMLLAKGGLYADFWNRQSGGFLGVEAAE